MSTEQATAVEVPLVAPAAAALDFEQFQEPSAPVMCP